MFNLNQLKHFLQIARSGSLSAAAHEIGVSAPALSKSLAGLEAQVGARLFDRVGRGLQLTAFGAELVEESAKLLGHAEQLYGWADRVVKGEAGTVRVGCGPLALQGPVSRAATSAPNEHDQIRLDIVIGDTASLLPGLDDHSFDFLVSDTDSIPLLADPTVYQLTPLPREAVTLVCSEQHPLLDADPVSFIRLLEHTWVSPHIPDHYLRAMVDQLQSEDAPAHAFTRLQNLPDIRVENIDTCLQIAKNSHYISATLATAAESGQLPPGLRPLPVQLNLTTSISVIALRNRTITPAASRLIDLILEC
jgi:DNA-binding transcriptional LysR family regulator